MALDAALERLAFEEPHARYKLLHSGVTYGDAGDNRVQNSIETILSVISRGVKNGRALARQTSDALEELLAGVRAEIIAEFFAKEQNGAHLFPVARELENRAHARSREGLIGLSVEAKSIIGVFADFVGAKRTALLSSDFVIPAPTSQPPSIKPDERLAAEAPPALSTGPEQRIVDIAPTPRRGAEDSEQSEKSADANPPRGGGEPDSSPTLL